MARRTLPSSEELNRCEGPAGCAFGEGHLDDVLVGLPGADDAAVENTGVPLST